MKKKAILCSLILVLMLSGCSNQDTSAEKTAVETTAIATSEETEAITTAVTTEVEIEKTEDYPVVNHVDDSQTETVEESEPEVEFEVLNLGSKIEKDFVEMTVDSASTALKIEPTDTSGYYSYQSAPEGETFLYITGELKNTGSDSYSADEVRINLCFDDKYNYSGWLIADDGGYSFTGAEYVKPFGKVKYYIYSSIPNELIETYSKCEIKFAFKDNFKYKSFDAMEEMPNRYKITITK